MSREAYSQRSFELAIVGGGPAGASTALFLSAADERLASRTVLIDKASFPRPKICAGALGRRADLLLAEIGVTIDVPGAELMGMGVLAGRQRISRATEPIGRVVRRHAFDAALLAKVEDSPVQVMTGVKLEAMCVSGTGVELKTSAGQIHCQALIGADGMGSRVRRSAGFPPGQFHAQAVEIDTPIGDLDPDLLFFDLSDRQLSGYAWDFPTIIDGQLRACRGVYQLTRGVSKPDSRDVTSILRKRSIKQGIDLAGVRFKRFSEQGLGIFQALAKERVLLVGEAAGIDPALGEGIAQAIFYGKCAGNYLVACRGDYRFGDYRKTVIRSRLGLDLRLRSAATPFVYGWARPLVERWVSGSEALSEAGMEYFAGRHVPRSALLRAALDFALAR